MAGEGGADYLYTFGFAFDTSGFDSLLSAVEGFASRAQQGFGSSVSLPPEITGSGGGSVPLGGPGEVAGFTEGFAGSVETLIAQLREAQAAGRITGTEFTQGAERLRAAVQALTTAAKAYGAAGKASGLVDAQGRPIPSAQDIQARRDAATKANPDGERDAITRLLPSAKRVSDSKFIVDPANRERLEEVLQARAAQTVREREFRNRDRTAALQALQDQKAVDLQVEENLERKRLKTALERETLKRLALDQDAGGASDVRQTEVENRLASERLKRADETQYLSGRKDIRISPEGGVESDIEQEAAVRLARQRDRLAVELGVSEGIEREDIDAQAQLTNAKRKQATQVALSALAQEELIRQNHPGGPGNPLFDEANLAAEQRLRQARVGASTENFLAGDEDYLRAEARRRALHAQNTAEVAVGTQTYLAGSDDYTHNRATAAAGRKIQAAKEEDLTQQQLLYDREYTQATAQATAGKRSLAASIKVGEELYLSADESYVQNTAEAAAIRKATTAEQRAITTRILAEDEDYIRSSAAANASQRALALALKAETRAHEDASSFNFVAAEARDRVADRVKKAQISAEEGRQISSDPFTQISLVNDESSGNARRKIIDAQINAQEVEALRESQSYKDAEAKAAANKRLLASEIEAQTVDEIRQRAARQGETAASILAAGTVKRQALDEEVKLEILQQQIVIEREQLAAGKTSVASQRLVANKELQVLRREGAQQAFSQAGFDETGTRFQRAQALIDLRRNGNVRSPEEYQTLGSFFGQRALNTAGYLSSGLLFYGIFDQLKQAVTEASAAQRQFQLLKSTLEATDNAGKFEGLKSSLLDISNETGKLSSETINVFRQLYAALGQNTDVALKATRQSLKFSEVTGLDPKEINDSLTAIALSFNITDFTPFLDQAINLENRFGVLSSETVQFAADLAPLASGLGFTAQQLEALGAAAQAVSGRSGGALSEQLGRTFEALTDPTKISKLTDLFQLAPQLRGFAGEFGKDLGSGNIEQSFAVILRILAQLDKAGDLKTAKALRTQLIDIAGGPRQAGALAAVLERPQITLDALEGKNNPAGALEDRFQQVRDSLAETFSRIKREIESFFQEILQSGAGDALQELGGAIEFVVGTATTFLRVFESINSLFGGLPGRILVGVFAVKALSAAIAAVQSTGLARAFFGIGAIKGGAAAQGVGGAGGAAGTLPTFIGSAAPEAAVAETAGASRLSRLGTGLKSLGPTIATTVAALAVGQLVETIVDAKTQVDQGVKSVADNVDAAFAQGVDSAEILRRADLVPGAHVSPTFVPGIHSGPSPYKAALDQLRRDNAKRQGDELNAILGAATQRDRELLAQQLASESTDQPQAQADLAQQYAQPGQLEAYVQAFLKDPTNVRANDSISRLIGFARGGGVSPEVKQSLIRVAQQANKQAQDAAAVANLNSGADDQSIESAIQALSSGYGSIEEVRAAANRKIEGLKTVLAGAGSNATERDKLLQEIAKTEQDANKAIAAYFQKTEQQQSGLLQAQFGKVPPAAQLAFAQYRLSRPEITGEDRFQAILDVFNAQRSAYDNYVAQAADAQDKLARIQEGTTKFAFPSALREEAIRLQIQSNPELSGGLIKTIAGGIDVGKGSEGVLSNVAEVVGTTVDDITNKVVTALIAFGQSSQQILLDILEAKKAEVQQAIDEQVKLHPESADYARYYGGLTITDINNQEDKIRANAPPNVTDPGAGPTTDPQQAFEDNKAARQEELQKQQLYQDLAVARRNGDPVAQAQANVAKARLAAQYADGDQVKFLQAQIDEQTALNALADAQNAISGLYEDLAAAQAHGDPVAVAQANLQKARIAIASAGGNSTKLLQGLIDEQNALNALADAQVAIGQAYDDYAATVTTDPVTAAKDNLAKADDAVANAHGVAAQYQALAQRVQAERAVQKAIDDVSNSQLALLETYAQVSGDTVKAADIALQLAQQKLDQVIHNTPDDQAAINAAKGEVATATRNAEDASLKQQQDDIQFALDMKQITKAQAINMLQALLQIPTNTLEQTRAIQREIENLRGQLNQDFRFNIPNIVLPTIYQARALQSQANGPGTYTDNRQITINFGDVNANDPRQVQQAIDGIVEAIAAPPRNGSTLPAYLRG